MGELADDTIEGRSCSFCGVYFVEEHGYPVLCENCYEDEEKELKGEKPLTSKATKEEL